MIKGVKFVSIPVLDQDRALSFYTDKPFDDKQRWIELSIPGAARIPWWFFSLRTVTPGG